MMILRSLLCVYFCLLSVHAFGQVFAPGEQLTYAVKKLGMKVGTATITYQGPTEFEDEQRCLIIFDAKVPGYIGTDFIYANCQSFLPEIVVRDIRVFGKKEAIVERYDGKGNVSISKGKEWQEIAKPSAIDNIYTFIYRYRQSGDFQLGKEISMQLPTKDVILKVKKETRLSAMGQKYKAWYLKSKPSKYKIWFSKDQQKLPLRISGSVGMTGAIMVLTEHQP